MVLTSPTFCDGEELPIKYTCQGAGVNPPLHIQGIPQDSVELALVFERAFSSNPEREMLWSVGSIPPTTRVIAEGENPPGIQGINAKGEIGYRAPCALEPGDLLSFRLIALHTKMSLPEGSPFDVFLQALQARIIRQCTLSCRFPVHDQGS